MQACCLRGNWPPLSSSSLELLYWIEVSRCNCWSPSTSFYLGAAQYFQDQPQAQEQKLDELLRTVLFSLHGNFFLPEEERWVTMIMWELARLQIADTSDPLGYLLRTSTCFTR